MPRVSIPKSTAQAWQSFQKGRGPFNPGLVFERFAPDWGDSDQLKKQGLDDVRKIAEKADRDLLQAWNDRWEAGVHHCGAQPFTLQTDWRFISGLGRKGPLEVGFTFHRYGFPMLPGSSAKGIARAFALTELTEELLSEQFNRLDETLSQGSEEDFEQEFKAFHPSSKAQAIAGQFRKIFGTTAAAGQAIFFDAIPQSLPRLDLDVITPHYPKYYQGDEPPADWQSPIPVNFLAVAPSMPFRFAVGWRGALDSSLQELARDWLVGGLETLGAGGKTSAGYGYFVEPARVGTGAVRPATPPRPLPTGYLRGTVKDFGLGEHRSYGFILPDGGGAKVFVHQSALAEGVLTLESGQRVIFSVEINPRGKRQARDVRLED